MCFSHSKTPQIVVGAGVVFLIRFIVQPYSMSLLLDVHVIIFSWLLHLMVEFFNFTVTVAGSIDQFC
jgi:hypothetical protein